MAKLLLTAVTESLSRGSTIASRLLGAKYLSLLERGNPTLLKQVSVIEYQLKLAGINEDTNISEAVEPRKYKEAENIMERWFGQIFDIHRDFARLPTIHDPESVASLCDALSDSYSGKDGAGILRTALADIKDVVLEKVVGRTNNELFQSKLEHLQTELDLLRVAKNLHPDREKKHLDRSSCYSRVSDSLKEVMSIAKEELGCDHEAVNAVEEAIRDVMQRSGIRYPKRDAITAMPDEVSEVKRRYALLAMKILGEDTSLGHIILSSVPGSVVTEDWDLCLPGDVGTEINFTNTVSAAASSLEAELTRGGRGF